MNLKKVYKKIARQNGISVREAKREMQEALKEAWENCPNDGVTKAYQNQVPCKSAIPTPDELIVFAAEQIKKEEQKRERDTYL